jgi:benzoate transport
MTRFQVVAIMVCMVINMMDGFDVLVIAFTAPSISAEWGLSSTSVGVLLSSGLLGMVIGSLVLGPMADRYGRRILILTSLVVITVGMLLSALSQDLNQLAAMRFITGLGIGGILPGLNTIVAEYSSLRWRSFWVSFLQTGYPIGATVGGILSAVLIAKYGWRSAFYLGAAASLIMIPIVWRQLPESLDYLLARRPSGALKNINRVLEKLGRAPIEALPDRQESGSSGKTGYADLLATPALRNRTLLLCAAFLMTMVSFYFAMSWTPKILVDSGMSTSQGISGGIILNAGGVIGCLVLGFLSSRMPLPRLIATYAVMTVLLMIVFSQTGTAVSMMVVVATCLGFFLFGSMVGLYALAPQLYPPQSRAAGVSIAIGFGRIGGVASPMLAGMLFDSGWAKSDGYILFALPLVIMAGVIIVLGGMMRRSVH